MDSVRNADLGKGWIQLEAPLYTDLRLRSTASGQSIDLHNMLTIHNNVANDRQKMIQAGQQFEAYFISHLLKVMRQTVPEGAIANKQGGYFYSFYDEEIGRRAAEVGGIGIAQMVQDHAEKYLPGPLAEPSSFSVRGR